MTIQSASTPFERVFAHVLGVEGGYVNDPRDAGGATRFGITEAVARAWGYDGPMSALPINVAQEIYRQRYWRPLALDTIAAISEPVARELFDTGVNMGIGKAAEFFQIALNALNDQGRHYSDIAEDGAIGPGTIGAFAAYMKRRGKLATPVMLKALNCLQGRRYIDIARMRSTNEAFVFGWLANRID